MPVTPGTHLGPHEIQVALGAGGMGEVYKARDTRLDRAGALKVLPAQLSGDPDLRERLVRQRVRLSDASRLFSEFGSVVRRAVLFDCASRGKHEWRAGGPSNRGRRQLDVRTEEVK